MSFKVGDRVGVSKVLGRGGPAWRPATITGPSPHPQFQYLIEWDDKHAMYKNASAGHLCSWTQYERWKNKNDNKNKAKNKPFTSAAAAAASASGAAPKQLPPPQPRSLKELRAFGDPAKLQSILNNMNKGKKSLFQRHKREMREHLDRIGDVQRQLKRHPVITSSIITLWCGPSTPPIGM